MRKSHLTTTVTIQIFIAAVLLAIATQDAFARNNTGVRPTSSGQGSAFGVKPGANKGVGADGGGMTSGSGGASAPARSHGHRRPNW
jgi:uncharacterized membrane protein YgcG